MIQFFYDHHPESMVITPALAVTAEDGCCSVVWVVDLHWLWWGVGIVIQF